MLKIVLVDDEAHALEALHELLSLYHDNALICAACTTLSSAVPAIREHQPDLVFLDVELGTEKGFELFKHFPDPGFKVIFTTAHGHYAAQAFRFSALDYLLKPIQSSLLTEAIRKATKTIGREKLDLKIESLIHSVAQPLHISKRIVLKTLDATHVVDIDDIIYGEADGAYTSFYLVNKGRIVVSVNVGYYEELFSEHTFMRIHKSYLLNLHYFARYENATSMAILKDEMRLPVAIRKKEELLKRLEQL